MFTKNDIYDYMSIVYQEKTYIIVSKRRIEEIGFANNFLAIAECINTKGRSENLAKRAIDAIKKVDISSIFIKETSIIGSDGIVFIFNEENKQFILSFFNNIPFFT